MSSNAVENNNIGQRKSLGLGGEHTRNEGLRRGKDEKVEAKQGRLFLQSIARPILFHNK